MRWVHNGKDLIFPEQKMGDKSRGGIPITFPFFGSSPFETIPKHGWLRHQTLEVAKQEEDHVVLVGQNEKTTSFEWLLKYRVSILMRSEDALTINLEVERIDDGEHYDTPVNPGFHPYFISDPRAYAVAHSLARVGEKVISEFPLKSARIPAADPILIRSGEKTVRMELLGSFDTDSILTLWSDEPTKYFCVEPVLQSPDRYQDADKGKFLKPGNKLEISLQLSFVGYD